MLWLMSPGSGMFCPPRGVLPAPMRLLFPPLKDSVDEVVLGAWILSVFPRLGPETACQPFAPFSGLCYVLLCGPKIRLLMTRVLPPRLLMCGVTLREHSPQPLCVAPVAPGALSVGIGGRCLSPGGVAPGLSHCGGWLPPHLPPTICRQR